MNSNIIQEQIDYYRARARAADSDPFEEEYEKTSPLDGRYGLGPDTLSQWLEEERKVTQWVGALHQGHAVLEVAAGTGWWTQFYSERAESVLLLDSAPEMLRVAEGKFGRNDKFAYRIDNILDSSLEATFDSVTFAMWLSHVPKSNFVGFWRLLARSLRPDGYVTFVDHLPGKEADTNRNVSRAVGAQQFQVVKVFWEPQELRAALAAIGWRAEVQTTGDFFYYGVARPS